MSFDGSICEENCIVTCNDLKVHMIHVHYQCDTTQALEGDPKYLAPELMQGRFTKSADIFRYRSESLFTNNLFVRFNQGINFYCPFTIHFYAYFIFICFQRVPNRVLESRHPGQNFPSIP